MHTRTSLSHPTTSPGPSLSSSPSSSAGVGASSMRSSEPRADATPGGTAVIPGRDEQACNVLSTLESDGRRRWMSPRPSVGTLWRWRRAVAFFLIALFTLLPYLQISGKPAILLDLTARRFTLLGKTFLPTDTLLLALLLVCAFVTVFLLTALAGRVWCGWGCPQTVYMEFVYRPIERFFSGTPGRSKNKFQQSPAAMVLKILAYFLVSCFLAHTFLAYFVGVERLMEWVRMSPTEHPTPFLVMAATTALMMFDFVYFREQTCIVACPYGRLQSVLLDRQSKIISYDRARGEPRGKGGGKAKARAADVSLPVLAAPVIHGDCVDCRMCVTTCPTGIDIRNGLQMECVNCAQCIDACDAVMTKIGRPTGLIRYSSEAAMEGQPSRVVRPRVVIYSIILVVLVTAFITVLARKGDTDVNVLRGLGAPFITLPGDVIGNQLRIKVVNRRETAATYEISAQGPAGVRVESESFPLRLESGEMKMAAAIVEVPAAAITAGSCTVQIVITDGAREVSRSSYTMMGPAAGHHAQHERREESGHDAEHKDSDHPSEHTSTEHGEDHR